MLPLEFYALILFESLVRGAVVGSVEVDTIGVAPSRILGDGIIFLVNWRLC